MESARWHYVTAKYFDIFNFKLCIAEREKKVFCFFYFFKLKRH